jgi:hypothetical protein
MQLLERGIYMPRCFTVDGQYYMVVIDSHHRKIREYPFPDLSDAPAVEAELRSWLDTNDPVRASHAA